MCKPTLFAAFIMAVLCGCSDKEQKQAGPVATPPEPPKTAEPVKTAEPIQPTESAAPPAAPAITANPVASVTIVRDHIISFRLQVNFWESSASTNQRFRSVVLAVRPSKDSREIQISRQTALRLVDLMEKDGFFENAEELHNLRQEHRNRWHYALVLSCYMGDPFYMLYKDIGWDLGMVARLAAIRDALDGDDEARQAMTALLDGLETYRSAWEKAAADPACVEKAAKDYQRRRLAGEPYNAWASAWYHENLPLLPMVIPIFLASENKDECHEGLILARGGFGRMECVPQVISLLDRLLKNPKTEEAGTRRVACQVLGQFPDRQSIPVLIQTLDDPYTHEWLTHGPPDHASWSYSAVWWDADEALRQITGAKPIPKPTHSHPDRIQQQSVSAAWKAWHQQKPSPTDGHGNPVAWGESANGLQAGLSLGASREPRSNAILVLHLRNAGNKPVRILNLSTRHDARSWGMCLPLEIRSSGAILKYQGPVHEPPPPPDESYYITLNPGDADSAIATLVLEHWKLAAPFDAQAVFVFKNEHRESMAGPYDQSAKQWRTVGDLWTGEVRSQAVNVKMD